MVHRKGAIQVLSIERRSQANRNYKHQLQPDKKEFVALTFPLSFTKGFNANFCNATLDIDDDRKTLLEMTFGICRKYEVNCQ